MNKQVLLTRKQDHLPTPHPWYQHEGSSLVMTRVQSGRKEASSEKDQWRCIRCSLIYPGGMAQRYRGTEAKPSVLLRGRSCYAPTERRLITGGEFERLSTPEPQQDAEQLRRPTPFQVAETSSLRAHGHQDRCLGTQLLSLSASFLSLNNGQSGACSCLSARLQFVSNLQCTGVWVAGDQGLPQSGRDK